MRGNGRRRHLPVGELGEQAVHHRLDGREHVLLGDEAHLDVELVELARAAVGAGILVAKAGCDLEVPVEAGDHVELLVLLRRLRQGVELARMQARRHQEVARTLGRRGGQDRRLELGEALLVHVAADARDHPRAQHDVALHLLAAQIEEAILEPGLLGIVALGVDLQRQGFGRRVQGERVHDQLDLAGRQRRVDRLRRAGHDPAGDGDDAFDPHPFGRGERGGAGLEHELGQAGVIAQVDEE